MNSDDFLRKKWDERYKNSVMPAEPSAILSQHPHLLSTSGKALDVACGLGGNAVFLAKAGYQVDALDLSSVAISKLSGYAALSQLDIAAQQVNLSVHELSANYYDLIIVSYFLDRDLLAKLVSALKSGGIIFYQTFAPKLAGIGPDNPDFRFADNELLDIFKDLKLRYYREDAAVGDMNSGMRDIVMLVAEKF